MIERVLRAIAIAIALLAMVDPPVTLSGRVPPRVSIVVQGGPSMRLPSIDASITRQAAAERVRAALDRELAGSFELIDGLDPTAATAIVIGDRYPEAAIPESMKVSTVTVAAPAAPGVRIAGVNAPAAVPPATAIRIGVMLEASGVRGSTTMVTVRSRGVEVGRASHAWAADSDAWRAEIDVVPVGEAPFRFEIAAGPEVRASIVVDRSGPLRVLVYEARPSWASAFVRRALEGDARFAVGGVSHAAPRAAVRSGTDAAFPLDRLDAVDAIVVGGLDRLAPSAIAALGRFFRDRGGSVALLPDGRIPADVAGELLRGVVLRETLLERAAALEAPSLPRLDAAELLEATTLPAAAAVLARTSSSRNAVIWTLPQGQGTVLVSGALDAWRYRAAPQTGFDRFWRSAISALALAARPAVDVELSPRRAAAGETVHVTATVRAMEVDRLKDRLAISGRVNDAPVRLWPDVRRGVFTGSFVVDRESAADGPVVSASIGESARSGVARLSIDDNSREPRRAGLPLLAEGRGGVNATPGDLTRLVRHLRTSVQSDTSRAPRHPMRSAWWFAPFAACLGAEWWLRRRSGRR